MKTDVEPPLTKAGRSSIVDVAKASGVSVATVSRVLNGLDGVRDGTADRVRSVVGQLKYRPLRVRRRHVITPVAPSQSRTGNLAVIALGEAGAWLQLPVMAAAVNGIRAAADAAGYRMLLSEVLDPLNPGTLFRNREIDGAVVFVSSTFDPRAVAQSLQSMHDRLPVVWAMGGPLAVRVDHVSPDHFRIGQLAHEYLESQGCRSTAYVTISPAWPLMRVRGHGFTDRSCDVRRPARTFVLGDDPLLAAPYGQGVTMAKTIPALVAKLAAATPRLDGIHIANDRTAAELYPHLARVGLLPGPKFSIIACDNEETRLTALHPRPATIDIGAEQIGRRAVARLLNRIARPHDVMLSIHVVPHLVLPPK